MGRSLKNAIEHGVRIAQNLIIPEPQDTKPLISKPAIAIKVGCLTVMLAAIHFDYQGALEAHKINNVSSNHSLTLELDARQPMRS
jgi:hypothetical protein